MTLFHSQQLHTPCPTSVVVSEHMPKSKEDLRSAWGKSRLVCYIDVRRPLSHLGSISPARRPPGDSRKKEGGKPLQILSPYSFIHKEFPCGEGGGSERAAYEQRAISEGSGLNHLNAAHLVASRLNLTHFCG